MGTSSLQAARRSFVKLLLALAAVYNLTLTINRDSTDEVLTQAFRKVAKKVHPDKGGDEKDSKNLHQARDAWKEARKQTKMPGRPWGAGTSSGDSNPKLPGKSGELADPRQLQKGRRSEKRVRGLATMLTYFGIRDYAHWRRFVDFVAARLNTWGVKHWSATLERTRQNKLHVHLYLQFHRQVDKTTFTFVFDGLTPRADDHDLLGEGVSGRKVQESINRGFFYVWADKIGTERDPKGKPCVAGNYEPVWTSCRFTYPVLGKWAFNLWHDHKLTHERYEEYLHLCRDNVVSRKRNLDAVRAHEEKAARQTEMDARVKRIRSNKQLFKEYPDVPAATRWLEHFKKEVDRYPILVVLGKSRVGKTEWAKRLFKNPLELKVGNLPSGTWPNRLRSFKRAVHDAVILDDVRDCQWLVDAQDKIQGKYDGELEFASTQGGTCAFELDLWRVPVAVTINYATRNRELLQTDDFLGHPDNRELVTFNKPAWEKQDD